MDCAQARELTLDYLYGLLDGDRKSAFEEHLAACGECRARLDSEKGFAKALESWEPSVTERDRVGELMKRLRKSPRSPLRMAWKAFRATAAVAACVVIALAAIAVFGTGEPDEVLTLRGSKALVAGKESRFLLEMEKSGEKAAINPEMVKVTLHGRELETKLSAGGVLTITPPKNLAPGEYGMSLSYGDKIVARRVDLSSPSAVEIYAEKSRYRPRENPLVYARVYDRTTGKPLSGSPVEFVMRDSKGRELLKKTSSTDDFGISQIRFGNPEKTGEISVSASVMEGTPGDTVKLKVSGTDSTLPGGEGKSASEDSGKGRLLVSCFPEGGVVLPGKETTFYVYTRYDNGEGAPCTVTAEGIETRTDENGVGSFRLKAGERLSVKALDEKGLAAASTINVGGLFRGRIAVRPEKRIVERGSTITARVELSGDTKSPVNYYLHRGKRLAIAGKVDPSDDFAKIEIPARELESGIYVLTAETADGSEAHSSKLYVKPEETLILSGSIEKQENGLRVLAVSSRGGAGPKAYMVRIAPERPVGRRVASSISNEFMLGLGDGEFPFNNEVFMGVETSSVYSGGSDPGELVLASKTRTPDSLFAGSSAEAARKSIRKARGAALGYALSFRYLFFPAMLVLAALGVIALNVRNVLSRSMNDRSLSLHAKWVMREIAALVVLGGAWFVGWSLVARSDYGWFVFSQVSYPLGMVGIMWLIVAAARRARRKSGRVVDLQTRLVEYGILVTVFIPTQFFGPHRGGMSLVAYREYMDAGLYSIVFFLVFVGALVFARDASMRRRIITRYSPALAAVAVFLFIAVSYVTTPRIGTPKIENVMNQTDSAASPAVWFKAVTTGPEGAAEIVLPPSSGDSAVIVHALDRDGARGTLVIPADSGE